MYEFGKFYKTEVMLREATLPALALQLRASGQCAARQVGSSSYGKTVARGLRGSVKALEHFRATDMPASQQGSNERLRWDDAL
jgi:hypothetical protein